MIQNNSISFKAKILPTKDQAKYFYKEYPLLGKFIPQHCFGIQKYDGSEFTRYLFTTGCSVCSKLSLYEPIQKIGLFSHVDSEKKLLNSVDKIRELLLKNNVNLKSLIGNDIPGTFDNNILRAKVIRNFFKTLGLKAENIHTPQKNTEHKDGGIIDLKNGKLYELDSWSEIGINLIDVRNSILKQLNDEPKAFNKALKEYQARYKNLPSAYTPIFHQIV